MNWTLAIKRNRDQIKDIVLGLFVLAKMRVGGSLFTLERDVLSAIMLVLRPAEAAVRRLIVIAAFGLKPSTSIGSSRQRGDWSDLPTCGGPKAGETGGSPWQVRQDRGGREGRKAFKLFDPLKSFDHEDFWDEAQRQHEHTLRPLEPASGFRIIDATTIDATQIGQRLNALMRALEDLPRQARRLVRWQAKRDALLKACKPTRMSLMRPGLPPGWRERKIHEIDDVLRECHGLANERLNAP